MSRNFNSFPVSVLRAQQVGPELILNPHCSQGHRPLGTRMPEGLFAQAEGGVHHHGSNNSWHPLCLPLFLVLHLQEVISACLSFLDLQSTNLK